MLIICKSCHARREWKKTRFEKIADQACECGGKFKRLDCFTEGCKFTQLKKCESDGYCEKRRLNNGQ